MESDTTSKVDQLYTHEVYWFANITAQVDEHSRYFIFPQITPKTDR